MSLNETQRRLRNLERTLYVLTAVGLTVALVFGPSWPGVLGLLVFAPCAWALAHLPNPRPNRRTRR